MGASKPLRNFLQIREKKKKYTKRFPFLFYKPKSQKKMKLWAQAKIAHCCSNDKYRIANVPAREWKDGHGDSSKTLMGGGGESSV